MEFKVAGFPRAVRASEDDGVPLIQEHLRRAAGVFSWVVRDHLEDKADVANARPDVGQLPRRFRLRLVVEPGRQIPRYRRRVLQPAYRIAGLFRNLSGASVVSRMSWEV